MHTKNRLNYISVAEEVPLVNPKKYIIETPYNRSYDEEYTNQLTNVKAYNRENGIMWLCYSLVFWISTIMGLWEISVAGIVLTVGCLGGIPILVIAYSRICRKYKR